jgi:hypothetical protein
MNKYEIANLLLSMREIVIVDRVSNLQISLNNEYKCKYCNNYSTKFKWSIKRHIESHLKVYIHKCDKCPYQSNERCHLDRHKKSFNH